MLGATPRDCAGSLHVAESCALVLVCRVAMDDCCWWTLRGTTSRDGAGSLHALQAVHWYWFVVAKVGVWRYCLWQGVIGML
jgi:hypothetical protein